MEYFYSYQVQLFSSKLHCVLHYEFIYYGSTRSSCKHLVTNQYALRPPRPALNGRATTLPQGLCTYITLCLEGLSAQNYKFCFFSLLFFPNAMSLENPYNNTLVQKECYFLTLFEVFYMYSHYQKKMSVMPGMTVLQSFCYIDQKGEKGIGKDGVKNR